MFWENIQIVKEILTLLKIRLEFVDTITLILKFMAFQSRRLLKGTSLITAVEHIVWFFLLNIRLHRLGHIIMPALSNVDFHTCKCKIVLFSGSHVCLSILEIFHSSDVWTKPAGNLSEE